MMRYSDAQNKTYLGFSISFYMLWGELKMSDDSLYTHLLVTSPYCPGGRYCGRLASCCSILSISRCVLASSAAARPL